MSDKVIIVREYKGIGIDSKLNGYSLDGRTLKRRMYSGLCWQDGDKRVYYSTLKKQPQVKIELDFSLPF